MLSLTISVEQENQETEEIAQLEDVGSYERKEQKFEIKAVPLKQPSPLQMTISQLLLVVFVIHLFIYLLLQIQIKISGLIQIQIWIAYKMRIHYLVGVNHFAECRENCHENCLLAV